MKSILYLLSLLDYVFTLNLHKTENYTILQDGFEFKVTYDVDDALASGFLEETSKS